MRAPDRTGMLRIGTRTPPCGEAPIDPA